MPLSWECGAGTMQDVARQPFVVTFAWLEHDVQGERHHCVSSRDQLRRDADALTFTAINPG